MKTKYLILFFAIAFLIVFLRRTDALLYSQFWAEDGKVWFANAYNLGGFKSLFLTQDGYFQTLSRITALFSLVFPINRAPFIFNLVAMLVQILPALLLVSGRFEKIIPKLSTRLWLAILYLLLPNTAEIHANITNAQWFLSLSAFLVLAAPENEKKSWKIFDSFILIVAGLSGPFSILLLPVVFLFWFFKRGKQHQRNLFFIVATATIQIFGISLLSQNSRWHAFGELPLRLIFSILERQIVWGSLIGANGYSWILNNISWYFWLFAITTFFALLLVIHAMVKSPLELKLFLLFGGLVFAASLFSPSGDFSKYTPLELLSRSTDGVRYWLIPMCTFLTTLVWSLTKTNHHLVKILSGVFLATTIFGVTLDFEHPKFIDYQFHNQIQNFQELATGQKITIPINPTGWTMELMKH